MLLLCDVEDYLENDVFDGLEHNFLKGYDVLVNAFDDCEVGLVAIVRRLLL